MASPFVPLALDGSTAMTPERPPESPKERKGRVFPGIPVDGFPVSGPKAPKTDPSATMKACHGGDERKMQDDESAYINESTYISSDRTKESVFNSDEGGYIRHKKSPPGEGVGLVFPYWSLPSLSFVSVVFSKMKSVVASISPPCASSIVV